MSWAGTTRASCVPSARVARLDPQYLPGMYSWSRIAATYLKPDAAHRVLDQTEKLLRDGCEIPVGIAHPYFAMEQNRRFEFERTAWEALEAGESISDALRSLVLEGRAGNPREDGSLRQPDRQVLRLDPDAFSAAPTLETRMNRIPYPILPLCLALAAWAAVPSSAQVASPPPAPNAGFLHATVTWPTGESKSGFLRWKDEEAFWDDLFHSGYIVRVWGDYVDREALRRERRQEYYRTHGLIDRIAYALDQDKKDPLGFRPFVSRFGDLRSIEIHDGDNDFVFTADGARHEIGGYANDAGSPLLLYERGGRRAPDDPLERPRGDPLHRGAVRSGAVRPAAVRPSGDPGRNARGIHPVGPFRVHEHRPAGR